MSEERPPLHFSLNGDAVAAPVHAAAVVCREIVDFNFDAMARADLSKKPPGIEGAGFQFNVRGPELTADRRRALYENWILAKAFQDLMRGARASLETAYVFIQVVGGPHKVASATTLADFIGGFSEKAAKRQFPVLLRYVNSRLSTPLEFAEAYQSMQNARNCLEHRGGIVGKADVDQDGEMQLRFPRIRVFYSRGGEEVEVVPGSVIEPGSGESHATLMMRLDLRERRYKLGERLTLTAADFNEIAFACFQFGSLLASRLPTTGVSPSAQRS